ncbi:zf-CCHC domain-containing protein [Tanacetum coccineum]
MSQLLQEISLMVMQIHHSQISKSSPNAGFKPSSDDGKKVDEDSRKDSKCSDQEKEDNVNSTNNVNAASTNKVNARCLNRSLDSDKYLQGKSMQRPPLFESDHFIYWKNRFETYVKAKDLDLWHIILNGDFPPVSKNEVTQVLEVVPFEEQSDDLKTILAKNKKAKMVSLSKNYVRKFLRALHSKWIAKVTAIEESKDFSSLAQDELIGNLKVHEVVMEKDYEIYKDKKERVKPIALKAKKDSSDDETLTSRSDDEEYATAIRNFKKFFRIKGKFVRQPRGEKKSFRQRDEKKGKNVRKCFRCGDPNRLIGDCPKPSRNKDQKAFIGDS